MAVFATKVITSSGEVFTARHHAKMFIACLSYANLCFLNVWAEMQDHGDDFLRKYALTWQKVAAVTLDVLIVAIVAWGILYLALSSGKKLWIRAVKWASMVALLIPLNVIRTDETFVSLKKATISHTVAIEIVAMLIAAAAGLFLILNWERLSARVATTLLIVLAPTMPLALANVAWHVSTRPQEGLFPNKPLQPALPQLAGAPHLIWIIFDEWDQALTFEGRPAGLSLPEIDRFQAGAFHANRVYPPARYSIVSVPSLLAGRVFIDSKPKSRDELLLTYDQNQAPESLTTEHTIFSEARRRGFNVGIAGWYLPYCRLIPECTACNWFPALWFTGRNESAPLPLLLSMKLVFTRQIRKVPLISRLGVDFEDRNRKALHIAEYQQVHADMLQTITDRRLNLVFVHMGIPHPPAIYIASSDSLSNGPNVTYADNLRLLDRTIRDLRQTLEASGIWDTSTILLAADHPLRLDLWRNENSHMNVVMANQPVTQHAQVPFLLKMAGEKQGLAYDKPMQEIVTKDLLLAILNGEVTTSQQVAGWLDRNPPHL